MTNTQDLSLEYVLWSDADARASTWMDVAELARELEADQQCLCETVGWVVSETKHYIALASSIFVNRDMCGHCLRVPKKMILKRLEIVDE